MTPTGILIHNVRSRRGKRLLPRVRARLHAAALAEGVTFRSMDVANLDRFEPIDAIGGNPRRIVVLGGDGTANAAVSWAIAQDIDPSLAIVPAGTGNNLARDLGVPLDPKRAMDLALGSTESELRRVDAFGYQGEFGSRILVQMAALGFPADVVAWYQALRRIPLLRLALTPLGTFGYKLLALAGLSWAKRRERRGSGIYDVRIQLPDERIEERTFAIFVGNGSSTGGNFVPCPGAQPDDGLLDLCLVRAGTRASYLKLFRSFARGGQLEDPETVLYRLTAGPLEIELSAPGRWLVDGELPVRTTRVRLEVLPGRLRFVVPRRLNDDQEPVSF